MSIETMDVPPAEEPEYDAPFDYLTMQQEWTDWLNLDGGYDSETGPAPVALIAEMTRRNARAFTMELLRRGILWDPMEGTFGLGPSIRSAVEELGWEEEVLSDMNRIWENVFDKVSLDQDAAEKYLAQKGLL